MCLIGVGFTVVWRVLIACGFDWLFSCAWLDAIGVCRLGFCLFEFGLVVQCFLFPYYVRGYGWVWFVLLDCFAL